jgi:hypothetical protein
VLAPPLPLEGNVPPVPPAPFVTLDPPAPVPAACPLAAAVVLVSPPEQAILIDVMQAMAKNMRHVMSFIIRDTRTPAPRKIARACIIGPWHAINGRGGRHGQVAPVMHSPVRW